MLYQSLVSVEYIDYDEEGIDSVDTYVSENNILVILLYSDLHNLCNFLDFLNRQLISSRLHVDLVISLRTRSNEISSYNLDEYQRNYSFLPQHYVQRSHLNVLRNSRTL